MNLNPDFTSFTLILSATTGGELAFSASAGIALVHGWLVDSESHRIRRCLPCQGPRPGHEFDRRGGRPDLTRGLLVGNSAEGDGGRPGPSQAEPSDPSVNLAVEERQKVEDDELSYSVRRQLHWYNSDWRQIPGKKITQPSAAIGVLRLAHV
jgi:hypothetical protein